MNDVVEKDLVSAYLFQFHLTALPFIFLTVYLYVRSRGGTLRDMLRHFNVFDERFDPVEEMRIASVATLATMECAAEFDLFHCALRHHHPDVALIVATTSAMAHRSPRDSRTTYHHILDRYPAPIKRSEMEATPGKLFRTLHDDFMMEKATILAEALASHPNCLLVDCDVLMMAPLPLAPKGCTVGLSHHRIRAEDEALFGRYNGGWVYTDDRTVPDEWRRHTVTSRYYDQAALEDIAVSHAETLWDVPPQSNFGYWRLLQSDDVTSVLRRFSFQRSQIHFDGALLQSVHTHFCMPELLGNHGKVFNRLLTLWMKRCSPTYDHILPHLK